MSAPGVDRVERGSPDVLAPEHIEYVATAVHGLGLAEVWGYFLQPHGYPEVPHWCESYEERTEGFLWVVRALVDAGYAGLVRREASRAGDDLDDLIRELRRSMPSDEQELGEGDFFFVRECPIVIRWNDRTGGAAAAEDGAPPTDSEV